jgi:putative Mn2+ efflux pump MntP
VKLVHKIFPVGHFVISLLFMGCALALIILAGLQLWQGIQPVGALSLPHRLNAILESIAILTVAVAALELGQTIIEEEVQRDAQMSAPTRVRRFLSRFMIVLVVALSIETLVTVFKFSHENPAHLSYAAAIGLVAAALLAAWGLFVRLNQSAEQLEPEAMREAKQEDAEIKPDDTGVK